VPPAEQARKDAGCILFFLRSSGVTISTGEFCERRVDVHEVHSVGVDLLQRIAATLGDNQVAGVAVARGDGFFPVSCNVIAIMTTETTVPIFVSNEIGMSSPVRFYLGEKVGTIDRLCLFNNRVRLRGIRISCM